MWCSSPILQGNADKSQIYSSKNLPLRPPPPRSSIRRPAPLPNIDTTTTSNPPVSVKSPVPMLPPRRPAPTPDVDALATADANQIKPKPPVRTRKKKFATFEPSSRQSEFVELSTSDIIMEGGGDREDLKIVKEKNGVNERGKVCGGDPVCHLAGDAERKLEADEDGASDDGGIDDSEQAGAEELVGDGWELVAAEEDDHSVSNGEEDSSPPILPR